MTHVVLPDLDLGFLVVAKEVAVFRSTAPETTPPSQQKNFRRLLRLDSFIRGSPLQVKKAPSSLSRTVFFSNAARPGAGSAMRQDVENSNVIIMSFFISCLYLVYLVTRISKPGSVAENTLSATLIILAQEQFFVNSL
jgi:hypothetical protein